MRPKNPILRQITIKWTQRVGEPPPRQKNNAQTILTHMRITPYLTPSSLYRLPPYPHPGSHTPCIQKHTFFPPQQQRHTTTQNEAWKFFSLPKRVKPQNCLDLFFTRRLKDTTDTFANYVDLQKIIIMTNNKNIF